MARNSAMFGEEYVMRNLFAKALAAFLRSVGWSFGLGVVGAVSCLVTAALFLTEANIQRKKRNKLKESQAQFEMEHDSKA
ncbi:hypothetical protein MSG28_000385 [Choristoneura fumiferana]|uniref:Uncharacterized protein n=1 Tax=Choristoneura fumiferana TaxID=7141 RepID=A0ACC0K0L6_CHOFU|nr:hypothetical protein MSG28_000385 [Choristoneura fumiferana]